MRTDLYGLVHKAQRYHLFGFARELSRADLGDASTRERLARDVRQIADMLVEHAHNEARYIHPLFVAIGGAATALEDEHRELEAQIERWTALAETGRWQELYSATMRLIAEYLLHIDAEERAQTEVLWPAYDDAALAAVMLRFKQEREPAAAEADLALFMPALGVPELAALLANLRAAPAAVRERAIAVARRTLEAPRWAMVEAALSS